ncbi:hydrogenase expression protein HypA [Streptomyces sp. NPDC005004]
MGTNGSEAADAPAGGDGPRFTVVMADDGSAAIDGEPVLPEEGESVDSAVLDALHRHARESGAPVTAAVRDPSAGYVAHVEVAPDGSSRLLGQEEERLPGEGAGTSERSLDGAGPVEAEDAAVAAGAPEGAAPPGVVAGSAAPVGGAAPPGTAPGPAARADRRAPDTDDAAPVPPRPRARQSDDEYEPPGFLGRPLVVGPVALGVAALVVVPLVIIGSGGSDDGHQREIARASDVKSASPGTTGAPPTAPAAPRTASPSPSPTTSEPKKRHGKPKKPKAKGGTGGGVTVTVTARPPRATATVTAKPPAETAGTAVNRLAASDPGGRHICYRAYVSGQGWQKPVCDGTMAGTTGRNRAIKALEIAVRGVGGSAANAFVHKPGSTDGKGVWQPSWTAVTGDGGNFRVGGAAHGAPDMLGFAVNVGSGRICQATRLVGSTAWSGTGCADARPAYAFGGTLDNDRRLEAVRFTV